MEQKLGGHLEIAEILCFVPGIYIHITTEIPTSFLAKTYSCLVFPIGGFQQALQFSTTWPVHAIDLSRADAHVHSWVNSYWYT